MKKIIFDCDSTVGLDKKPMDDALALLYLLGRPDEAGILGITCTFANGTAEEVFRSTTALLTEIGRTDIPLLPGAEAGEDPRSPAAQFIVETVNAHPGEITLVAIGSLTNLYGAWMLDGTLFEKVREKKDDDAVVMDKLERLKNYTDFSRVPASNALTLAKVSVVIDEYIREYHLDP